MERYHGNVLRYPEIISSSDRLSLLKYSLQVSGSLEFLLFLFRILIKVKKISIILVSVPLLTTCGDVMKDVL